MKICTVEGCDRKQKARTWCTIHWGRWRRHGDPTKGGVRRVRHASDMHELVKVDANGCHVWLGEKENGGYGRLTIEGKSLRAHRVAYELANGPIPSGMLIDHACQNRACVNVEHLRLATNKQNGEHLAPDRANNTSGYRGATFSKKAGKWLAHVRHNRKRYNLGFYDTASEAGEAARIARNNLFTYNNLDRVA